MTEAADLTLRALADASSFLFVPGDRPERFSKASASGADQIIIDLEDAVAAPQKATARLAAAAWFAAGGTGIVRINAADAAEYDADVDLCRATGVTAIMLPKAEDAAAIADLAARTGKPVIALVETARGLDNVRAVAAAAGVVRLAFGSIDLSLDLGLETPDETLDGFRLSLTLASRLAGLSGPIDGVLADFRDAARLAKVTHRVRGLGFTGKLAIHPAQIEVIASGFTPSADELAWARRVVAVGESAVALDGEMIDRPVREQALRLLARAGEGGASRG